MVLQIWLSAVAAYPYEDEIQTTILKMMGESSRDIGDLQIINDLYIKQKQYLNFSTIYLQQYQPIVNLQLAPPETYNGSPGDGVFAVYFEAIIDYFNFDEDVSTFALYPDTDFVITKDDENKVLKISGNSKEYSSPAIILNSVSDSLNNAMANLVFVNLDATTPENLVENITLTAKSSADVISHFDENEWSSHLYRLGFMSFDAIKQTYNKTFDELNESQLLALESTTFGAFASMQAITASVAVKSYFAYNQMIEEQYITGLEIEDVADPVTQNVLILNQKVLDIQTEINALPIYGKVFGPLFNVSDEDINLCFRALGAGCMSFKLYQNSYENGSLYCEYDPTNPLWHDIYRRDRFTFCPDALPDICSVNYAKETLDMTITEKDIRYVFSFAARNDQDVLMSGKLISKPIAWEGAPVLWITLDAGTKNSYDIGLVDVSMYLLKAVSLPFNIPNDAEFTFTFFDKQFNSYAIASSNQFDVFSETVEGRTEFGLRLSDFSYPTNVAKFTTNFDSSTNWGYSIKNFCYCIPAKDESKEECPPERYCARFYDPTLTSVIGMTKILVGRTYGPVEYCYATAVQADQCSETKFNTFYYSASVFNTVPQYEFSGVYTGSANIYYLTNEIKTNIETYNDFEGYIITALNSLAQLTLPRLDELEERVATLEKWVESQEQSSFEMLLGIFLSVSQIGFALADISKSIKTMSKLNELKIGRRALNEPSLADEFIEPFISKNLYTSSQTYDPVRAMYDSSIYNYAHLYYKKGWRSDILNLDSTQHIDFNMLRDRNIALDVREIMQLSNTDFLHIQKVIEQGLPKIDAYLAPFGSVQALKSPISELGAFGNKIKDIKILTKGEKSFLSNSYQKYPYHTSTVTTVADIDEAGDIIVSTRFAGVGEPSIIGPTNVKNPKVKLGYIKTQYKYNKDENKLELLPWDQVKIGDKQMYEQEDINELYRAFYQEGFGWTPPRDLTTEEKWEAVVLAMNAKIKTRDVIDSVPLPNSIFHDMVDGLVYFSQGGNSFSYNLLNNNCQNFVKSFAQIISGKQISLNLRSSDYSMLAQRYMDQAKVYFKDSQYMLQHSFAKNVTTPIESLLVKIKNTKELN